MTSWKNPPWFNTEIHLHSCWNFHSHSLVFGGVGLFKKNIYFKPSVPQLDKKRLSPSTCSMSWFRKTPWKKLTAASPTAITHELKGTWSEANLHDFMFQPFIFRVFVQLNGSIHPSLSSQGPLLWPPERNPNNNHFHIRYPYCLVGRQKPVNFKMEVK